MSGTMIIDWTRYKYNEQRKPPTWASCSEHAYDSSKLSHVYGYAPARFGWEGMGVLPRGPPTMGDKKSDVFRKLASFFYRSIFYVCFRKWKVFLIMYFDYLLEPLPPLYELARPDRWKFDTMSLILFYIDDSIADIFYQYLTLNMQFFAMFNLLQI
jgi:hypothetical protein